MGEKRTDHACRPRSRRPASQHVPRCGQPGAWLWLLGLVAAASALSANPFYVSPNGKDTNEGGENTPFRTIQRARDAARAAAQQQDRDIVVYLREGRYEPDDTLRFDGNDSARNGFRVIYRSMPGEEVRISGGRRVTGWQPFRDGIYRASAPVPAFRQIYVDGRRGVRARTPNSGYERLRHWGGDNTIDVPAHTVGDWSNLNHAEIVIDKHWHQSRLRIADIRIHEDYAKIVPQEPERTTEWYVAWPNREPDQPFFFENSLDFLDSPGEWYLDRNQQQLYYMPRADENLETAEVIVPRLERLLEIDGASDLHFVGLIFEHTTWTLPDREGFIPIQANLYVNPGSKWMPSGIHVENSSRVRFERNILRNMGGGAIALHAGTSKTEIVGNAIADIAASGISVYTDIHNPNPPKSRRSRGDIVRNNFITRVGQDYPGGVAIVATYSDGALIEHNELFDNPYTGISVGWGWTSNDTALRNNIVRYNRIHQVMNLLDDGAGIYTLSKQPGGIYEENFIYDLTRNPFAGSYMITALYLDEQTEGISMRNNVVRNLAGVEPFKTNRVRDGLNHVSNNGPDIANADAIMANAGLQAAYRDLPDLVPARPKAKPGPFHGEPAKIPGRIEAEDFDRGGPGEAYFDTTPLNQGGEYRPDETVDIEPTLDEGGGFNIGYTAPGEWLQYTVDVAVTGAYELRFRLASINSGRHFHVSVDGENVTGRIDVPNTNGWQNWRTVAVENVFLEQGERKLRIHFDTGDFNINWLEAVALSASEPPVSEPTPIPGTIFAVDYDVGGQGVAYFDTTPGNTGGAYRDDDVDIEIAHDTEAEYNVGWFEAGEWIHYTVDVTEPGRYDLHLRLASASDDGSFHLTFDGKNVTGRLTAPNTGGWQNWKTVTLPDVYLPGGVQTMRLNLDGGEFNISRIDFELADSIATFGEWTVAHFSPAERDDPQISGPSADPHGDGVPNLLKYALNLTPGNVNRTKLPVLGQSLIGNNAYLTLSYTRPGAVRDVDYIVEVSDDLRTWTANEGQTVEVSSQLSHGIRSVTVRDARPLSAADSRFLRLRVEQH